MARNPKSITQHKRDGTYRRDRHGDRVEHQFASGLPEKPATLNGDASRLWDSIIENMPAGSLCSIDGPALVTCCSAFSFARRFRQEVERDPSNTKALNCWLKAEKLFLSLSGRFGLTPADRSKLSLSPPPAPTYDDPMTALRALTATQKNDR